MVKVTAAPGSRFLPLLAEATMIVFAVLLALGVEEWREERQMRQFAARARAAVLAEVSANLAEFRGSKADLDSTAAVLARVVEGRDLDLLQGSLALELPEFSSAAWRAAQASQAAPYLDYEWVIQVSRAYEVHAFYDDVARDLIVPMSRIVATGPTLESVDLLFGRLTVLLGIRDQLEDRLAGLLEGGAP